MPLWLLIVAAEWLDLVWAVLVLLGVEKIAIGEAGSVALSHMPYSHGLMAALLWGSSAILLARWTGLARRRAFLLGGLVISHWFLDWVSHYNDLPLLFAEPKVGLGLLAQDPYAQLLLEAGMIASLGAAAAWRSGLYQEAASEMPVLCATLFALALCAVLLPGTRSSSAIALTSFATIICAGLVARLLEGPRDASPP